VISQAAPRGRRRTLDRNKKKLICDAVARGASMAEDGSAARGDSSFSAPPPMDFRSAAKQCEAKWGATASNTVNPHLGTTAPASVSCT
jgi:hypothetical protein